MNALRVTAHAIERYQERVANLSDEAVIEAILSPAVVKAATFGAPFVRLATGQRIVIEDSVVVTVLPSDHWPAALDRRRRHA